MKRIIWGLVVAATGIVAGVIIYEDLNSDLPGDYGGGWSSTSTLVVGFPSESHYGILERKYGIERESYWADGAGNLNLVYLDMRRIPPGCKHHISTDLLVGDLRFSLPLRPCVVGMIALIAVSAPACFFLARPPRQHLRLDAPTLNS